MNDRPAPTAISRAAGSTQRAQQLEAGSRVSVVLPRAVSGATLRVLDRAATGLMAIGVSANAITLASLALAASAGVLLSIGVFGVATALMVVASLGDALDGLIARRSGSACARGALLDAFVDRYEEFFFLGGLAVFFHDSVPVLVLTLFALVGSFMVSYGSAKAEAFHLPVPAGAMRRAERAVCLCAGVAASGALSVAGHDPDLRALATRAPVLGALALVAITANVSAIRRLRAMARGASRATEAHARGEGTTNTGGSTSVVPTRPAWRIL